ncbi:MAG: hypothetical protein K2J80_08285 [Oscillospiraceae bacterium]|nr:hypothetical protein [Oscillospiraceae bacterium]
MSSKKSNKGYEEFAPEEVSDVATVTETVSEAPPAEAKAEPPQEKSGVFVYLGPNLKGVINNGSIFTGTRSAVISTVKKRVEDAGQGAKMPKISRLIVADADISKVKAQLGAGGNALCEAYKAILAED